jgi:hypothetical protein
VHEVLKMSGAGKIDEKERDEILVDLIIKCRIAMRRAASVVVREDASTDERQRAARGLYGALESTNYLDSWRGGA